MISLIFSLFFHFAPLLAQEQSPGFMEGVTAYQNKEYQKAQTIFQSLLEQSPENPALIYNLGLAEFQLGKQGLALGLWRKARNIDSGMKDAHKAIEYVEGLLFPSEQTPTFFSSAVRALLDLPLSLWIFLSLLSFLLTGWLAIELGAKRKKPFLTWPVSFYFLIAACLFTTTLASVSLFEKSKDRATVVQKNLLAHTGPSETSPTLSELKEGQIILLLSRHNGWVQIRTLNGNPGWVPESSVIAFGGF